MARDNGFNQNFISESKNLDSYDRLDELVQIVGKNAKHNLTTEEIKSIASIYLSDNIDFKKSQLKGDNDYLNGIYYYHPSIKSILKYSNLLRSDLGLSKITDKNDLLDERVIKHYGNLVPLTPIDSFLLENNQKIPQQMKTLFKIMILTLLRNHNQNKIHLIVLWFRRSNE